MSAATELTGFETYDDPAYDTQFHPHDNPRYYPAHEPSSLAPAGLRRPLRRPERLGGRAATVTVLHPPVERSGAGAVRLTRRGVVVLCAAVAVLSAALVGAAWLSAPPAASTAASTRPVPASVVVGAGDTLWSIATQVAPGRDPQAEIADLVRLNHLSGSQLVPGEVLRTH